MFDIQQIRGELIEDVDSLQKEVDRVYSTLVIPHWGSDVHGFPHTLYGYMMVCLAKIDVYSAYWEGDSSPNGQTSRMVRFMQRYMSLNQEIAWITVKIWRHKLMHTSEPRTLVDERTRKTYRWLLHWSDQLPSDHHFTFTEMTDSKILNIGLTYFINNLRAALTKYLADLATNEHLQKNFEQAQIAIESEKI